MGTHTHTRTHTHTTLHGAVCRVTVEGLNQALRKGIKAETVVRVRLGLYYGEKCIRSNQLTTPKTVGPVGTVIWNERIWMDPTIKLKDLPKVSTGYAGQVGQ